MARAYDVVVAGLGAMGSAVACEVARRGLRVLGLDRFDPPHAQGSSHGETRIIREAYFEHPLYVPLVQRAYERWEALERESETRLFVRTGGLMIGASSSGLVTGALASAQAHALPHEILTAAEVSRRHPALMPPQEAVAVWEPRAGVLFPERCIDAHLRSAARSGATLRPSTPLASWRVESGGVTVATSDGETTCRALVLAAGAWLPSLVPELSPRLTIERQVLHWFQPRVRPDLFTADRLPVLLVEPSPGRLVYGIPELPEVGAGVKVARHHEGESTSPESLRGDVSQEEVDAMQPFLAELLPDLVGGWDRSAVCMYTNTPDRDFLIDWHPADENVLLLSPCSGHGFKFSTVIGELAADLVTGAVPRFDLSAFRLGRFGSETPTIG